MPDILLYEVKGNCAYVTLNRPEFFNAFDDALSYAFQDALKQINKDEQVRVAVITGAGKAFCSGQDLKVIADTTSKRSLSESLYKRYNPMIRAMRSLPKPIICRLNGIAAGAGCSLALACDIIIAAENAGFIEAFVNVGLVLDSGSSYFLPRLIGSRRAFEMATTGAKISAAQAFDWGMVNKVVPAERLDEEVDKAVSYYQNAPTKAIGLMKAMLNKSTSADLDTMLDYEAYCQEIAGRSSDYAEGVTAFNEKRKPAFIGK